MPTQMTLARANAGPPARRVTTSFSGNEEGLFDESAIRILSSCDGVMKPYRLWDAGSWRKRGSTSCRRIRSSDCLTFNGCFDRVDPRPLISLKRRVHGNEKTDPERKN